MDELNYIEDGEEALDLPNSEKEEAAPDADTEASDADEVVTDTVAEADGDFAEDYGAVAKRDLDELRSEFYEARELSSITELDNPVRFAELRELGLSPREAYLATQKTKKRTDNRSHLIGAAPRGAARGGSDMSHSELMRAREIFSGMSDAEIQLLYKRVTKH